PDMGVGPGHANDGSSGFNGPSRVSRRRSWVGRPDTRRPMKYLRLILAAFLLFVGLLWLYLRNGQYYSNSLGCIACCSVSAAVCVWELCCWGRLETPRRWAGVLLLLVDLGLATLLAAGLPEDQKRQEEFNRKWGVADGRGGCSPAVAGDNWQSETLPLLW